MPEEPDCEAKARIDEQANEALGDIDGLLTTYQQPEDLQLRLNEVREHLVNILSDTHHHN
jgi:hypothetical protein